MKISRFINIFFSCIHERVYFLSSQYSLIKSFFSCRTRLLRGGHRQGHAAGGLIHHSSPEPDFARDILNLDEFKGSEETTKFIRIMNDIFDLQNTSNFRHHSYRKPMTADNCEHLFRRMNECCDYLSKLTDKNGLRLVKSKRKTGFLGLIMNCQSFIMICERFIKSGRLKFLMTRRFSQDFLEHTFGR